MHNRYAECLIMHNQGAKWCPHKNIDLRKSRMRILGYGQVATVRATAPIRATRLKKTPLYRKFPEKLKLQTPRMGSLN